MPLSWSKERQPCIECRYTHVVSETLLGKLTIEWKGWKDYDSPVCSMPWDEVIIGIDLADTKRMVQEAWNRMAKQVLALAEAE